MKYNTKLATLLLIAVLVCAVTPLGVLAQDTTASDGTGLDLTLPTDDRAFGYFAFFGGVVQEITRQDNGSTLIYLKTESRLEAYLVLSPDTYVAGEIKVGAKVTGYYDQNAPMIMIYPPHYAVEAIIVEDPNQNIAVGVFDENLINTDNSLKLNLSGDTQIITQGGAPYTASLANRKLVVYYDGATKSIPAQTTPKKIVVLYDREFAMQSGSTKEEMEAVLGDLSLMDIMVENKKIVAPAAYLSNQGTVMVPVRAIAEALGYRVNWISDTRSVLVGDDISFAIGQSTYRDEKAVRLITAAPPELTGGFTYVPLHFFKEVAGTNNAYVFEGQIVIDNREPMN